MAQSVIAVLAVACGLPLLLGASPRTFTDRPESVEMWINTTDYQGPGFFVAADEEAETYVMHLSVGGIDGYYTYDLSSPTAAAYSDGSVPSWTALGSDGLARGFLLGTKHVATPREFNFAYVRQRHLDFFFAGMCSALGLWLVFSIFLGLAKPFLGRGGI